MMMKRLSRKFFDRDCESLAREAIQRWGDSGEVTSSPFDEENFLTASFVSVLYHQR